MLTLEDQRRTVDARDRCGLAVNTALCIAADCAPQSALLVTYDSMAHTASSIVAEMRSVETESAAILPVHIAAADRMSV